MLLLNGNMATVVILVGAIINSKVRRRAGKTHTLTLLKAENTFGGNMSQKSDEKPSVSQPQPDESLDEQAAASGVTPARMGYVEAWLAEVNLDTGECRSLRESEIGSATSDSGSAEVARIFENQPTVDTDSSEEIDSVSIAPRPQGAEGGSASRDHEQQRTFRPIRGAGYSTFVAVRNIPRAEKPRVLNGNRNSYHNERYSDQDWSSAWNEEKQRDSHRGSNQHSPESRSNRQRSSVGTTTDDTTTSCWTSDRQQEDDQQYDAANYQPLPQLTSYEHLPVYPPIGYTNAMGPQENSIMMPYNMSMCPMYCVSTTSLYIGTPAQPSTDMHGMYHAPVYSANGVHNSMLPGSYVLYYSAEQPTVPIIIPRNNAIDIRTSFKEKETQTLESSFQKIVKDASTVTENNTENSVGSNLSSVRALNNGVEVSSSDQPANGTEIGSPALFENKECQTDSTFPKNAVYDASTNTLEVKAVGSSSTDTEASHCPKEKRNKKKSSKGQQKPNKS